ncbi:TPA_asm: acr candidate [Porphyromonas phage phage032a_KCOM2801]|uniref:Acr candidate n=2 Tax=root TaxID=1 RepID=A0AAT9J9P9_9CAUD
MDPFRSGAVLLSATYACHICDMITDDMIKTEFIGTVVRAGLKKIYQEQEAVLAANLPELGDRYKLSRMPQELEGKKFGIRVLIYLRFLDIKYRKGTGLRKASGLALYNRVIWGVLYHETLPKLRYGFTEDIKNKITADLMEKNK